jgi:hypothetical protein
MVRTLRRNSEAMGVMLCLQRKMAMIHMDLCLFTNKQMALGAAAIYHLRALTACHMRHLTRARPLNACIRGSSSNYVQPPPRPQPGRNRSRYRSMRLTFREPVPEPIWSHHDRPSVRHRDSRCKLL